jgi:hypothetical protein
MSPAELAQLGKRGLQARYDAALEDYELYQEKAHLAANQLEKNQYRACMATRKVIMDTCTQLMKKYAKANKITGNGPTETGAHDNGEPAGDRKAGDMEVSLVS